MSNLKVIALTDEMIAQLTSARDEMQRRRDETVAQQAEVKSSQLLLDLAIQADKAIGRIRAWMTKQ
jgi:hypothetical protein